MGGGAIYAISFIIVGVLFPPEKRARAQGLISGVWGVVSVLGPLMGGLLTEYWSWRWIFFVNLPSGLLASAFIMLGVHEGGIERRRPRLDLKGATTLLLALLALFYALQLSGRAAYLFSPVPVALIVSGGAALLLFLIIERRAHEPLLPLDLFRLRLFSISALLALSSAMGVFGFIGYLPLFVQGVLGGSPSQAGSALISLSLGWTAGSFSSGPGMNRLGYRQTCLAGMVFRSPGSFDLACVPGRPRHRAARVRYQPLHGGPYPGDHASS